MVERQELNEAALRYYPQLSRVQRFVLRRYSERLTLAEVAQVARMERTAFSAFFHQKTGVCFRDWLADVRITRAKELLASENLTVSKVAGQVGYRTVRSFERAFLRGTGLTPAAYKRRVRPS